MNKFNICVDIDGTITEPFYWIEKANEFFGKSIKPEEVNTYHIHELYNVSREASMMCYAAHGKEMHLNAKIRKNAGIYLKKLAAFHHVFYITARMQQMDEITHQWFEKYDIPSTEIFFLGSHDKLNKARELECDIFIEDRYENAIQLSEAGIQVLLIDCKYNRNKLNSHIKRVQSWQQIYEEIEKYQKAVVE